MLSREEFESKPLEEQEKLLAEAQAEAKSAPKPQDNSMRDMAIVGGIPLLVGALTGSPLSGAGEAAKNIMTQEKRSYDALLASIKGRKPSSQAGQTQLVPNAYGTYSAIDKATGKATDTGVPVAQQVVPSYQTVIREGKPTLEAQMVDKYKFMTRPTGETREAGITSIPIGEVAGKQSAGMEKPLIRPDKAGNMVDMNPQSKTFKMVVGSSPKSTAAQETVLLSGQKFVPDVVQQTAVQKLATEYTQKKQKNYDDFAKIKKAKSMISTGALGNKLAVMTLVKDVETRLSDRDREYYAKPISFLNKLAMFIQEQKTNKLNPELVAEANQIFSALEKDFASKNIENFKNHVNAAKGYNIPAEHAARVLDPEEYQKIISRTKKGK